MMPTSPDYWCEHRYFQYKWDDHYQVPSATCSSPRYTALGLQTAPVWTNETTTTSGIWEGLAIVSPICSMALAVSIFKGICWFTRYHCNAVNPINSCECHEYIEASNMAFWINQVATGAWLEVTQENPRPHMITHLVWTMIRPIRSKRISPT